MKSEFRFTYANLEHQLVVALQHGYEFMTCEEYAYRKAAGDLPQRTLVNRVDIDLSCQKAKRLAGIFNKLNVKATFFVRLHASEYNPFSFENYRCLKFIRDTGHEIGYHSEIVDQAAIWNEDPVECLKRDISVLEQMLDIQVKGVASHGGMTGLNNLDFWKNRKASDFGLLYEAYEQSEKFNLFKESIYITDSEWTHWKCYDKGKLKKGDQRSLAEHVKNKHPLIYLLLHPETYYEHHFYE
jgi:hypothetical protein